MKKIISVLTLLVIGTTSFAQLTKSGLPLSVQTYNDIAYYPTHSFALPDWNQALANEEKNSELGITRPYLVGLFVSSDIKFPESGTFTVLENGDQIWKLRLEIPNAPGIGLYFDNYKLPEGVRLYLTNENKRQLLGAYTSENNSEDGAFAIEAVQGQVVDLELNLAAGVDPNEVELHIDRLLVYFRSISYLERYITDDNSMPITPTGNPDPYNLEGRSSVCGRNAICPEGANYAKQRKSSVQIMIATSEGGGMGMCSAAMINNTGNTKTDCKQYLLTASHCELSNSRMTTPFSQMLIRFNFENAECENARPATVNTLTGAKLLSRANYVHTTRPQINGDFMLLELFNKVPAAWDVYLAGWNRSASLQTTISAPKKYIGFHHPAGDVKKVSTGQTISPHGSAGGSAGRGTHWEMQVQTGGIEQGSSGSALFDGDGRIVGVASVAGMDVPSCNTNSKGDKATFMKYVAYSKMSYAWDYNMDGNFDYRKLKPWLDPANTGLVTLDAVKSTCEDITDLPPTSVRMENSLDNSVAVYPNPSTDGLVTLRVNFDDGRDLNVELYDVTGALKAVYELKDVRSESLSLDLAAYANGMYLLKINDGFTSVSKKVMLSR